jgi:uncharacterized protein YdeI (YjbR/CyaY-like superfamily)
MTEERETMRFDSPEAFRAWLHEHQDASPGIWLIIAKKASPTKTVSYAEAVAIALEHGWIDGQRRSFDAHAHLQRITPRRPQSPWSLRNVRAAETMIAHGRMAPRGLAEVARARADGRWARAYAGQHDAEPQPDFLDALGRNPAAVAFYATLNSQKRFAIYYRVQSAKRADTRVRRIETIVDRLARGEQPG